MHAGVLCVWSGKCARPGFEPGLLGLRRVLNRFVKMEGRDEGSGLVGTCWEQVPPFVEKTNTKPSRDSWDSFYCKRFARISQTRRHIHLVMEKPRTTSQEARPNKITSYFEFRNGSGTSFRHPNANPKAPAQMYSQSRAQV